MGRLRRIFTTVSPLRSQRGDTIVEVMISLIVISSILTGAFLVSRTNSLNIRTSQEHSEALQLLQGQVELLRNAASSAESSSTLASSKINNNCLSESATVVSGDNCVRQSLYTLSVTNDGRDAGGPNTNFTFHVQWDALQGGTNQESLHYRVALN